MGYAFHIGFLLALFFYVPHVLFFADIARGLFGTDLHGLTGLHWPTLPNGVVTLLSAISIAALVAVLVHRIVNPVKRLISTSTTTSAGWSPSCRSRPAWLAFAHLGGWPYERLLAVHLLSVELLLVWFPFGKLMHVFTLFVARGSTGMLFERKGASL